MKKLLGLVAMSLLLVASASAFEMTFDDDELTVPVGETRSTVITISDVGTPVASAPLKIEGICKELGGFASLCDAGIDDDSTTEISVGVDPSTDSNGKATVTVTHNGPGTGYYHYTVCVTDTLGDCRSAASATGHAIVPEFGTIGAALVLAGAGYAVYRKRKE